MFESALDVQEEFMERLPCVLELSDQRAYW